MKKYILTYSQYSHPKDRDNKVSCQSSHRAIIPFRASRWEKDIKSLEINPAKGNREFSKLLSIWPCQFKMNIDGVNSQQLKSGGRNDDHKNCCEKTQRELGGVRERENMVEGMSVDAVALLSAGAGGLCACAGLWVWPESHAPDVAHAQPLC